jgi:CRISPR/Cas system-associated exonuclease Cas4 (RecB family)
MRTLRASEIGSYLYCRRAWWYHLKGHESQNKAELAAGTSLHRQHGRTVFVSGAIRIMAMLALLAALALITSYCTVQVLQ